MENIITVNNLCKYYETYSRGNSFSETVRNLFHRDVQKVAAVNDISFTIPTGGIVGLLGPNGAGKSTTIKILTGVLFPSSGQVSVMGYVPWKQRRRYVANIGAVFGQKSQLIWDIPPIDSFYMNKEIYSISKADFNNSLDHMAELFHIGDIMKKPTRNLSLGERMKCEFVMAMLHNPPVVFLDEPTIGLDIIAKDTIREFILQMNKKGTTFILTTHDLEDVERLAHSVIIINHGEVVFSNTLSALKNHLGAVKTAHVVMKSPLRDISVEGVTVTSKISENEAIFAIDTAVTGISNFITQLNAIGELADISIKEPAIENVIKSLY